MVRISTPQSNAVYSTVPAETRSVTVSEEGYTISITEQENGDIEISGIEELSPEFARVLSSALEIWKWGLIAEPATA